MNFININFFIFLLFSIYLFGEEATFPIQTLNQSLNINDKKTSIFEELKNYIDKDIELSIQSHNLMINNGLNICKEIILNVNKLENNLDKKLVNVIIKQIDKCRKVVNEYREHIFYYKFLTRSTEIKNMKTLTYDSDTIDLLLKGRLSLKYYKLKNIKYNLENNNLIKYLLLETKPNFNSNILRLLNIIDFKYCQNKNRKHIIHISNNKSINIQSTNGVEY